MSKRTHTLLLASALTVAGLAGCQSRTPETLLLKKDPGSSVVYRAPGENDMPYGKNVIYVPRDARFSLSLEAINPGWLHEKSARNQSGKTAIDPFSPQAGIAGKDLWLVMHVRSLSTNDTLQVESKRITRATLVKHDMRSFGLIPLTIDEVTPFSLEADTDYEVDFRLYEVKKAFHRLPSQSRPGLSGVARTAWATASDTFKSLVGDSVAKSARPPTANEIPLERELLAAGGSLQFGARFAIYRSADSLAPRHPDDDARGSTLINRYQVTDPANRRDTDHNAPDKNTRYTDTASYLDRLQTFETVEVPGRQDAFLRFRVEAMWSPVARALAQIQAQPATIENVSPEQALAAESLAVTARENFMKATEEEKQAGIIAAESLRKSDSVNTAQLEETARSLSRKSQEVAAARAAMEIAQARARDARQAIETGSSRVAQTANAEKTVSLANAALIDARRVTDAAIKDLDASRAALRDSRAAAEAARLKKEEWMQTETRSNRRLTEAREELTSLSRKAEKKPDDTALRDKVTAAEREVAELTKAVETAIAEWKLAQKDQEAKLNEVEDRIEAVAQKRLALAEAEQERQRTRSAKDQADSVLNRSEATDPRPTILRARSF